MMVDVHMTDGRTIFRVTSRGPVVQLIQRDPEKLDESSTFKVWIDRGQGEGFKPARLYYLKKHSIAWVETIPGQDADAFLAEHAPEVLERIQAKRAEYADREPAEATG